MADAAKIHSGELPEPEILVSILGKDKADYRYQGCLVFNGLPMPCKHRHETSDDARVCAEDRLVKHRERMKRFNNMKWQPPRSTS